MTSVIADLKRATDTLLQRPACTARPRVHPLTLAVLGLSATPALAGQLPGDWDIRTATLVYAETGRVALIEPVMSGTRYFDDDRSLNIKLVVDSLTGASANGAVPSSQPQTFSGPSGNGAYTIPANETPLDDTFRDTRVALSGTWTQPLLTDTVLRLGLNGSSEFDYLSLGGNATVAWDLFHKNSTLAVGVSASSDSIKPVGGTPEALSIKPVAVQGDFEDEEEDDEREGGGRSTESKTVIDLLVGWTQIIDRYSLVQLNYSLSQSDGYLTDPYKIVSVVDPDSGEPVRELYEGRPDSRIRQALYAQWMRTVFGDDVIDASYRYAWDDLGLTSHTIDLHYRLVSGNTHWQPHLRYYSQSATDFYRPYLIDGEAPPGFVSADYRVAAMTAWTAGLEYGSVLRSGNRWRVAAEYYLQHPTEPANKPGQLANQTVAPDVDAYMLRFNYDFGL